MGNNLPKNNNLVSDEEIISPKTMLRMTQWKQNKTKIDSLREKDGDYNKKLRLYNTTKERGKQLLDAIKKDLIEAGEENGVRYIGALAEFIESNILGHYSDEEAVEREQNLKNSYRNLEPEVAVYIHINVMPILDDYFKLLGDIEKLKDNIRKNKKNMSELVFKNDDLGSIFALTAKPKNKRTLAHKKLNDIMRENDMRKEFIVSYLSKKPTPSPDSDGDKDERKESRDGKKGDGKQNRRRTQRRSRTRRRRGRRRHRRARTSTR